MKKFKKIILFTAVFSIVLGVFSGCEKTCENETPVGTVLLGEATIPEPLYGEINSENYSKICNALNSFSGKFTHSAFKNYHDETKNFAVSPVSVYLALGMAQSVASGNTKTQILSALDVSEETLKDGYQELIGSIGVIWKDPNDKVSACIEINNSIWVDNSVSVNQDKIDELAKFYYCSSYQADFRNFNNQTNQEISRYIKQNTHNLIEKNFNFSPDTVFTLINVLYLKDIWNVFGGEIALSNQDYDFNSLGGKVTKTKLMQSDYLKGDIYECDNFTAFHAKTEHGVDISFMLPNSGENAQSVYTAKNFEKLANLEYKQVDHDKKEFYKTRCLFPSFTASFDQDIINILKNDFGISDLFDSSCNLSAISQDNLKCTKVSHVTKLNVDRKGIEGAAVTAMEMANTALPDFSDYQTIYKDFIVDKSFGFTVCYKGVTLFSGVVNDINTLK